MSAPRIASVELAMPPHEHTQEEIIEELSRFGGAVFTRFARTAGVTKRHLSLPLKEYGRLKDFTEANSRWIETALDLGERALRAALAKADVEPGEVSLIVSTTVTGLAVPSLEARLAERVGLRPDVKRLPLFGLGCVAGAAGIARIQDYLRGYPAEVAVLLAVELCSLTIQRDDTSAANLVASSLFGDGAAAAVLMGADRAARSLAHPAPAVLTSRSRLYPDSQNVMGWDIGASGFRIVLSAEVASIADKYLGDDVKEFLDAQGLTVSDMTRWVCHPGGPKVIEAIERVLGLGPEALQITRESLRDNGNLSSASVLHVLSETMADPPPPGSPALMLAMGPGFCSELVLLRW